MAETHIQTASAPVRSGPALLLASGSPRRLALLNQIGIEPTRLVPPAIDEAPLRKELPKSMAIRLARTKAQTALRSNDQDADSANSFILAADTVVSVGRRILPKPDLTDQAAECLRLLSGRAHRVYTSICLITPSGKVRQKTCDTRVRFKRLSRQEIDYYLASGEWQSKAGGYAIQGLAGAFVVRLIGSYSNVVGLPLYETVTLLEGEGFPVHSRWLEPVA